MVRSPIEGAHCDVGNHPAQELRQLPSGMHVAGWCCPDCWGTHWQPHWPVWSTLTDYDDWRRATDPNQLPLFS
jgi:hypothetical protein